MTGKQILEKLKQKSGKWRLKYRNAPFPDYWLVNEGGATVGVALRTGDALVRKGLVKRGAVAGSLPSGGMVISLVPA